MHIHIDVTEERVVMVYAFIEQQQITKYMCYSEVELGKIDLPDRIDLNRFGLANRMGIFRFGEVLLHNKHRDITMLGNWQPIL